MTKQKADKPNNEDKAGSATTEGLKPRCGIVMPISAIDDCSEQHWSDVQSILFDAVESAGFTPHLVSDADDVGVIQKRIIQNLFENPIVVCDVSAKNPNVMFELGMRLAFDKPTIIIKDDKTAYSFDTAHIEHLEYPRDLRFNKIVAFKEVLAAKIKGTHAAASGNTEYTTFLKHFGTFKVAQLETKEVSKEDYIIDELKEIRKMLARNTPPRIRLRHYRKFDLDEPTSKRVLDAVDQVIGSLVDAPEEWFAVAHPMDIVRRELSKRTTLPSTLSAEDFDMLAAEATERVLQLRRQGAAGWSGSGT